MATEKQIAARRALETHVRTALVDVPSAVSSFIEAVIDSYGDELHDVMSGDVARAVFAVRVRLVGDGRAQDPVSEAAS